MILIFRRFTKGNKLDWDTFIEILNENVVAEANEDDKKGAEEVRAEDRCEEEARDEEKE